MSEEVLRRACPALAPTPACPPVQIAYKLATMNVTAVGGMIGAMEDHDLQAAAWANVQALLKTR